LHELHGTGNSTRLKTRENEPVVTGELDAPPEWLTAAQKDHWRYAIENAPVGVLGSIDLGILAGYVIAFDHMRTATIAQAKADAENSLPLLTVTGQKRETKRDGSVLEYGGNIVQSPYVSIINKATLRLAKCAAELGFTPASRPRLSAGMGGDVFLPAPKPAHNRVDEDENLDAVLASYPADLRPN